MKSELILTNATIVLPDEVISGTVVVRDGQIAEIDETVSGIPAAMDLEKDTLIPGLVELHTDNLERHVTPRPKTSWPNDAAIMSHDREVAASGITTVLDALAIGAVNTHTVRTGMAQSITKSIDTMVDAGALKADHLLHLRCEVSYGRLVEEVTPILGNSKVRLISLMDHTPGQRQFASLERYADYYQGKFGLNDAELEDFIRDRQEDQRRHSACNRHKIVREAHDRRISLASHDDATCDHVDEAIRDGIVIAEFPTTTEAAAASHGAGIDVLMGGPNMVRGMSHSGNVSARELAAEGYLDILSSDYVPASLLYAAVVMADEVEHISLPDAIATVTSNPARKVGLTDRGEIAVGKRADLVRYKDTGGAPVIRDVWRGGQKIA